MLKKDLQPLCTVTCCCECNEKKSGQSAFEFAKGFNLSAVKLKHIAFVYGLNAKG